MGYIKHHAIIVIGGNIERANLAHARAVEIFGTESVTPVLGEVYNGYCSFLLDLTVAKRAGMNPTQEMSAARNSLSG